MSLDLTLTIRKPVSHFAIGEEFTAAGCRYVRIETPSYALPQSQIYAQNEEQKSTGVFGPNVQVEGQHVFDANITHNLSDMAKAVELYDCCWKAGQFNSAKELIPHLRAGLQKLLAQPEFYRQYEHRRGLYHKSGYYEQLTEFAQKLLDACQRYPDAAIHASV